MESPLFVRRFHVPVESGDLPGSTLLTGQNLPSDAFLASKNGLSGGPANPANTLINKPLLSPAAIR
jgi:hypothetical protein